MFIWSFSSPFISGQFGRDWTIYFTTENFLFLIFTTPKQKKKQRKQLSNSFVHNLFVVVCRTFWELVIWTCLLFFRTGRPSCSRCLTLRVSGACVSSSLSLSHASCSVDGDSLSDRLKCWYLWTESSWHEFLISLMNAHHSLMPLQRKSLPCCPRAAVSLSGLFPLLLLHDCCVPMGRHIACQASCVKHQTRWRFCVTFSHAPPPTCCIWRLAFRLLG